MSNPAQATPTSRTHLPGFVLYLNDVPQEDYPRSSNYIYKMFPNALSSDDLECGKISQELLTLRELTMLQIMNAITDKPDWNSKIKGEAIVQRWRNEILASGSDVTDKMLNWCISELRYKATLIPPAPSLPPPIIVFNGDVVKSDFAVSSEFKAELQKAVRAYEENIPQRLEDWHPESDEKVWDLVHPPLVYGRSRILANGETTTMDDCIRRCGEGKVVPVPTAAETREEYTTGQWNTFKFVAIEHPYSAKFQWLPCEVDIKGDEARITPYVNNLHPHEEKPLYDLISKLITASIPLWELSLAPLRGNSFQRQQRTKYSEVLYDPDPQCAPRTEGPQPGSDDDYEDFWERRYMPGLKIR